MEVPQNNTSFTYCHFQPSHQVPNFIKSSKNEINLENNSDNNQIENELVKNTNKININLFQEQNPKSNLIQKINFASYNNISFIERRKESGMHYVGFENKCGDNSCYINAILHFLYIFPSVNEFLIKFYENKIDNFNKDISNLNNIDCFLFFLGKTLYEYRNILSNPKEKGIAILNTTELRQYLEIISDKYYEKNKIGDSIEFLNSLLKEINNYNKIEVHKDFFINLIEEKKCEICLDKKEINKYDENTFIHYININEIIQEINQSNITFWKYNHKLFKYSRLNSFKTEKKCEKCGNNLKNELLYIANNYPKYLLLNCFWGKRKPDLKDVLKFLYLLPLEENINDLFICQNKNMNGALYNLLGMILYSSTLSHYINVIFSLEKNLFVIYNDDKIKEVKSIHDVYNEITYEQIKHNPEVFFYPVLLIYNQEIIYNDQRTLELNKYSYFHFHKLEEDCFRAKNAYIALTQEQKMLNYLEYVKAQKRYDRNRKYSHQQINDSFGIIIEKEEEKKETKDILSNENNNINTENNNNDNNSMILEEKYENKEEKKRTNKKSGTHYINHNIYRNTNFDFFPNIF